MNEVARWKGRRVVKVVEVGGSWFIIHGGGEHRVSPRFCLISDVVIKATKHICESRGLMFIKGMKRRVEDFRVCP